MSRENRLLALGALILMTTACSSTTPSDTDLIDGGQGEAITFVDSRLSDGQIGDGPLVTPDTVVDPNDTDGDGLSNEIEQQLGTDPTLADTDNDGIDDRTEVGDPANPTDTDSDGKIDALEPNDFDTDLDQVLDHQDGDDTDGVCGQVKRLLFNTTLDQDTTLSPDCSPYKVLGYLRVTSGATLTVMPDVTITFGPKAVLQIGDSTTAGSLDLAGARNDGQVIPLILTADSPSPSPGFWRGVVVEQGGSIIVNQTTLSWAGGAGYVSDPRATVLVKSADAISITNSTFSSGQGYGLHAAFDSDGAKVLAKFENNTFTGLDHDLALQINHLGEITSGSNNVFGSDIQVMGGNLEQAAVWHALGVPFVFQETSLTISAGLKIQPGVTLVLPDDSYFMLSAESQLEAKGLSGQPITFTTATGNAGSWQGLLVMSGLNTLEHVMVKGAGWPNSLAAESAIYVDNDAYILASQVAIVNSSGMGVYYYMLGSGCSLLPTTGYLYSNVAGCKMYCMDDENQGACLKP